jgi:hypothetical protein
MAVCALRWRDVDLDADERVPAQIRGEVADSRVRLLPMN